MRYLEARAVGQDPARAVIQGAPWDEATSYRRGAAAAPAAVREASDSIESYSPISGKDLQDLDIADAGDIDLAGCDDVTAIDRIADATELLARTGATVLTIGGDHSISIGTSRGLREVYPDLVHLVYDAHMDLRAEYDGTPLSHACGSRHMAAAGPTCVLGVRSGSREEYSDAPKLLTGFGPDLEIPLEFRQQMSGRPLFVSLDMDVLDPSILPGTGTPEPGGPSYRELRAALLALTGNNIVGFDIVEVAPPIDPSGLSPVVAAELIRDCLLAWFA
ncbi:MAG: agmatinase [Actinomycetota bacterium]